MLYLKKYPATVQTQTGHGLTVTIRLLYTILSVTMPRTTRSSQSTALPARDMPLTIPEKKAGKGSKRGRKGTEAEAVDNATDTDDVPTKKKKKGTCHLSAKRKPC